MSSFPVDRWDKAAGMDMCSLSWDIARVPKGTAIRVRVCREIIIKLKNTYVDVECGRKLGWNVWSRMLKEFKGVLMGPEAWWTSDTLNGILPVVDWTVEPVWIICVLSDDQVTTSCSSAHAIHSLLCQLSANIHSRDSVRFDIHNHIYVIIYYLWQLSHVIVNTLIFELPAHNCKTLYPAPNPDTDNL